MTAVLPELDLTTGTMTTLSAAHPASLLVREGRALGELAADPGLPLGLGGRDVAVVTAAFQPATASRCVQ